MLSEHEPLSLGELGDLLVCETGSPSRLVNRLVETGLIEMKPSEVDSRKVSLALTEKGRTSVSEIITIEEKFYKTVDSLLENVPVQDFINLLWKQIEGKPSGNALRLRKKKTGT